MTTKEIVIGFDDGDAIFTISGEDTMRAKAAIAYVVKKYRVKPYTVLNASGTPTDASAGAFLEYLARGVVSDIRFVFADGTEHHERYKPQHLIHLMSRDERYLPALLSALEGLRHG